jgi:hypothetical protein
MQREFEKWVESVQPILAQHNIQLYEPITVPLPPFAFTTQSSLARRMNRLSKAPEVNELSPALSAAGNDTVSAIGNGTVSTVVSADTVSAVVTEVSEEQLEDVDCTVALAPAAPCVQMEDVFNSSVSVERNYHAWARSAHADAQLISFVAQSFAPAHGSSISEHFNACTVRASDIQPLSDYLVVSHDNVKELPHRLCFLDGSSCSIDEDLLFVEDARVEQALRQLTSSQQPLYLLEHTA